MRSLILLLLLAVPVAAAEKPITESERQFILDEIKEDLKGREPVVEVEKLNELAWARRIHLTLQPSKREVRLWDGSRCDILTPRHAIEVEWATKQFESFGQAVYYADTTDKAPAVILLAKDVKDEERHIYRARVIAAKLGIPLWLVDTRKNTLEIGGQVLDLVVPEEEDGDKAAAGVPGTVRVSAVAGPSTTVRGQRATLHGLV